MRSGFLRRAAETIRIAEHRQARIDALMQSVPAIEAKLGVDIEVVEYPAPEKDYLSKLLTELRAGNAPDIFTANSDADVPDMVAAGYAAPITEAVKAWDGYDQLFDSAKALSTNADGEMYSLASMFSILQLYYRRDILEKAGISTEQPTTWDELLDRAREIKAKTGAVRPAASRRAELGRRRLRRRLQPAAGRNQHAADRQRRRNAEPER